MATPTPDAPFGYDPQGRPLSDKSKVTAGLLTLFLGGFGVGRFYTGHTGLALGQLFTCGGCGIWSLIDAIIFFTSEDRTDAQGRVLQK
jgi:TM2 domain-containing membrane protein YozV